MELIHSAGAHTARAGAASLQAQQKARTLKMTAPRDQLAAEYMQGRKDGYAAGYEYGLRDAKYSSAAWALP
jgi:hypothetical protein